MRKIILSITMLLALNLGAQDITKGKTRDQLKAMVRELMVSKSEPVETEDSITVVLDNIPAIVPLDSLNAYIEKMDTTLAGINDIGDAVENAGELIKYTIKIKDGIAWVIKDAPLPNTKEGVVELIDLLQMLLPQIIGLLTFLFTAVFRILKKSPEGVKTIGNKLFGWIRTRYFVPAAGLVLSLAGFAFFGEGAWGAGEFVLYTVSSIVMAFGLDNIIKLISGFFDKK